MDQHVGGEKQMREQTQQTVNQQSVLSRLLNDDLNITQQRRTDTEHRNTLDHTNSISTGAKDNEKADKGKVTTLSGKQENSRNQTVGKAEEFNLKIEELSQSLIIQSFMKSSRIPNDPSHSNDRTIESFFELDSKLLQGYSPFAYPDT